jgi:hypothetical protein
LFFSDDDDMLLTFLVSSLVIYIKGSESIYYINFCSFFLQDLSSWSDYRCQTGDLKREARSATVHLCYVKRIYCVWISVHAHVCHTLRMGFCVLYMRERHTGLQRLYIIYMMRTCKPLLYRTTTTVASPSSSTFSVPSSESSQLDGVSSLPALSS